MRRRGSNKDANHAALRELWRAIGGEPDALIGWRGEDRLVEVKNPARRPSARKLRDTQTGWHLTWKGRPVAVVMSFDDLRGLFDE